MDKAADASASERLPDHWRSLGDVANAVVGDLRRRLAERAEKPTRPEGGR